MSAVLLASALLGDVSFATSLINPSDNPDAVSVATNNESSIRSLVLTIMNFALSFLGFVAVIMVIGAGILYVTSAGNDERTGQAKKILLYSVIGIVLILASFALVNTILGAAQVTAT